MGNNHLNFSERAIEKLPFAEKGKQVTYYDSGASAVPGLILLVSSGVKTFYAYKKVNSRPVRYKLGQHPGLSIVDARKRARKATGKMDDGTNPAEERQAQKTSKTLQDAFNSFLELHAKGHKKTWEADKWQFEKYLVNWKDRKLSSIKHHEVKALHAELGTDSGIYTANRVLALLTTIFNFSRKMGFIAGENPCIGIDKFHEEKRSRFIQEEELPRFFDALMKEPDTTARDSILMMLFTGQRRECILSMRWDEINLDRGEWEIPGAKMKGKETHRIPLVKVAMRIVNQKYKKADSEWVFPSERRDNHIKEPKGAWKRILEKAEISDLHFHDLRRTLASYMAITGASLLTIAQMLGHSMASQSVTGIYARLSMEPVQQAMETAVRTMLRKGGMIPEEESVIEFKAIV